MGKIEKFKEISQQKGSTKRNPLNSNKLRLIMDLGSVPAPSESEKLVDYIISLLRTANENCNSKDEVIESATSKIKSYIDENYHQLLTE
ncbi:hypothetical protein ACI7RC_27335 [Brevibacillus sp. B_LB10_24]|uniref:hypothetical protein n=1 Tax=Brevibacillus sp. B_LB10_24 TaxID=3380645 RepID=UPI0038BD6D73